MAVALVAIQLAIAGPAAASCALPGTVADNAARAVLVVHGTVRASSSGAVTVRVDRVLKGTAGPDLRVFVGPTRGGSGPAVAVSSVDYAAPVGTDHVLYVIKGEDGQLETNACVGSHQGAPTTEESALFGAGSSPDPGGAGVLPVAESGGASVVLWTAAALLVIALAALVAVRARRPRVPAS